MVGFFARELWLFRLSFFLRITSRAGAPLDRSF